MYFLRERYVFVVFRASIESHSFKSSNSLAVIRSFEAESQSFVDIQNTSKLTAMKEDIQGTDCNIFQPLTVLCMIWYCGYQATVLALVMIVLDMTSPYMTFSKTKLVNERSRRVPPRLLSPGNRYFRYCIISATHQPINKKFIASRKGNSPRFVLGLVGCYGILTTGI